MKYLAFIVFILVGNTGFTQEVVKTSISSCDQKSSPIFIKERLISKEIKEDTLILNLGLILNCCSSSHPKLTYKNDTVFLEIIDTSEIWCACDCCFEMEIQAMGISDTNFTLVRQVKMSDFSEGGFIDWIEYKELKKRVNKYIFPTPDELNSFTSHNVTNSAGLREGLWYIYHENSEKIKLEVFFYIEEGKERVLWSIWYDIDGNFTEICAKTSENESTCADKIEYDNLMND